MANLNGHEIGNGGYGQGDSSGNSPFLDPTKRIFYIFTNLFVLVFLWHESPYEQDGLKAPQGFHSLVPQRFRLLFFTFVF